MSGIAPKVSQALSDPGDTCGVGFRPFARGGSREGGKGDSCLANSHLCISVISEPGVEVQTCSPGTQETGRLPGIRGILGTWAVS